MWGGSHDTHSIQKAPREVVLEALVDKCEAAGMQRGVEFLGVGKKIHVDAIYSEGFQGLTFMNQNAHSPLGDLIATADSVLPQCWSSFCQSA